MTLLQEPTPQQLQLLRAGTEIEGVPVVPKVAKILQSSSAAATAGGQGSAAAAAAAAGGGRRGSSSRGGGGDSRGRCVLRLDVSEGKKHEVRIAQRGEGVLHKHRGSWRGSMPMGREVWLQLVACKCTLLGPSGMQVRPSTEQGRWENQRRIAAAYKE